MEIEPTDLYEQRLIVFLEEEDFSGFRQVLLNARQFKAVSDAIFSQIESEEELRPNYEAGEVQVSEDRVWPAEIFEGLKSIQQ